MSLNRRLLLGLTPLLLIFLVVGLNALYLFTKLGGAIEVILQENYASIVAAQNMKEAVAQMNTGLLFALQGEAEKGHQLFTQYTQLLSNNSEVEAHNITLPGEGDLEHQVQLGQARYQSLALQFFTLPEGDPRRGTLYFQQLLPASADIQHTAEQILQLNQQSMIAANERARELSRTSSQLMILSLLAGVFIAALIAYLLARSITYPVKSLTESVQQMGEGNLDQYVPVVTQDELGKLALAFNQMAEKLRSYRQSIGEQMIQLQQTMESALKAFPDPILVFSPEGEIRLKNLAADKFLNTIGGTIQQLPALPAYIEQSLKGAADFQPTSFDKALLVSSDEGEKFFLPRVLAMRKETGAVFGVVLALQDVTRFRVADDVKTNLIATVSHELKTPLTSMQMAVYLLLEEKIGPLNPKQTELLLAARTNSDRLFEMIEDLLDLARFEGGSGLIDKQAVSCHELLREVDRRERSLVTSRGLSLEILEDDHLPKVQVSLPRISQVFANFFSNAVKHSPKSGTITLAARREGANSVRFSVRDEGKGVPKDLQRRIFDKFFRLPDSEEEGVGLGLSIAREIVLAHSGSIGVESGDGNGSEFFFTLPSQI